MPPSHLTKRRVDFADEELGGNKKPCGGLVPKQEQVLVNPNQVQVQVNPNQEQVLENPQISADLCKEQSLVKFNGQSEPIQQFVAPSGMQRGNNVQLFNAGQQVGSQIAMPLG